MDLDFTPIGFEPMDAPWWPVMANSLPRPWPREAVLMDLRWWRGQEMATAKMKALGKVTRLAKMPGRSALRLRWGWGEWEARQALKAEMEWRDKWTEEPSSVPPAFLQPASSVPPHARQNTLTPFTDHPENTDGPEAPPPAAAGPSLPGLWKLLVAFTARPDAWKLTEGRRKHLRARLTEHGPEAVAAVAEWVRASGHERAMFLRERGDPDTLLRPEKFATYLGMTAQPVVSPSARGRAPPGPEGPFDWTNTRTWPDTFDPTRFDTWPPEANRNIPPDYLPFAAK